MSPSLVPKLPGRLRQGALWNEDVDPSAVFDDGLTGPVFLALQPPPTIAVRAYRLGQDVRDEHELTCPLIDPKRLHLSLLGCGRKLSSPTIDAIRCTMATVAMNQFRIGLKRMMSFDNKPAYPFVLAGDDPSISGVITVRQRIIAALRGAGCRGFIPSSFTPHMTLFWGARDLGEQAIDELCWTACDFVLIRSLHGLGKHELLGRWPLRTTV
jgi:RNA 2',3'-cyclic 3'-phosphodiesterase